MSEYSLLLTGEQIRAGRALVRIDQAALSRAAGVSLETVKRLERIRGPVDANSRTLLAVCNAFLTFGVVFEGERMSGVGVRMMGPAPAHGDEDRPSRPSEPLHRVIYHSRARLPADRTVEMVLANVLEASFERSRKADVTGFLLACDGR